MSDDFTQGLKFITSVRYAKDSLREINNLTFLFDPNWDIRNSEVSTLPVSFFKVQTCEEVMDTEVSTKQMLFYNSSTTLQSPARTSGLLNVVADNIVIKPKQYRMKVLVPANNVCFPIGSTLFNPSQQSALGAVFLKNGITETINNITAYHNSAIPIVEVINALVRDLLLTQNWQNGGELSDWVTSVTETPMFNKHSLEAMWRNRVVLKMKTWDSWKYKYVVITNFSIAKDPLSDGTYEGSITVQEMPILNVARITDKKTRIPFINSGTEAIGKGIIEVLNKAETLSGEKL